MHTHTYRHTHTHTHTHTHARASTHTLTHAHTYAHTHACTHARTHTHTHTHTHTNTYNSFILHNGKRSSSRGIKAAQTMMLPPPYFTIGMMLSCCCFLFAPCVLHVLPKQFYLSTIHFPNSVVECQGGLWQTFGLLQYLFREQLLHSWCPSMDTMPVQCFTYLVDSASL